MCKVVAECDLKRPEYCHRDLPCSRQIRAFFHRAVSRWLIIIGSRLEQQPRCEQSILFLSLTPSPMRCKRRRRINIMGVCMEQTTDSRLNRTLLPQEKSRIPTSCRRCSPFVSERTCDGLQVCSSNSLSTAMNPARAQIILLGQAGIKNA